MKVTTVRFSEDLWDAIVSEAERAGVSASQFIREAALARAAAAAGARGDLLFSGFVEGISEAARIDSLPLDRQRQIQSAIAGVSRVVASNTHSDAQALQAQSKQVMRRSEKLRERHAARYDGPKQPT